MLPTLPLEHRHAVENDFGAALHLPQFVRLSQELLWDLSPSALPPSDAYFFLHDLLQFASTQKIAADSAAWNELLSFFVLRFCHRLGALLGTAGGSEGRQVVLELRQRLVRRLAKRMPPKLRPLLAPERLDGDAASDGCDWRTLSVLRANERCARPHSDVTAAQTASAAEKARAQLQLWEGSARGPIRDACAAFSANQRSGSSRELPEVEALPAVEAWPALASLVRALLAAADVLTAPGRAAMAQALALFCEAALPDCGRLVDALRAPDDEWSLAIASERFAFFSGQSEVAAVLRDLRRVVSGALQGSQEEDEDPCILSVRNSAAHALLFLCQL